MSHGQKMRPFGTKCPMLDALRRSFNGTSSRNTPSSLTAGPKQVDHGKGGGIMKVYMTGVLFFTARGERLGEAQVSKLQPQGLPCDAQNECSLLHVSIGVFHYAGEEQPV